MRMHRCYLMAVTAVLACVFAWLATLPMRVGAASSVQKRLQVAGARAEATARAVTCSVGGIIVGDTTWGPESCLIYNVTASILIPKGASLAILPGSYIEFNPGTRMTVQGTLVARGTNEHPIVFTAAVAPLNPGDWQHIRFEDTSTNATFDASGNYTAGCVVQCAIITFAGGGGQNDSAAVQILNSSPYVDHVQIYYCAGDGVYSFGGEGLRISNSEISYCRRNGIHVTSSFDSTLRGNTVLTNSVSGIEVADCFGSTTISDNTASGNLGRGIHISECRPGTLLITGNRALRNHGAGINIDFRVPAIVSRNTASENSGGGITGGGDGTVITGNVACGNSGAGGIGIASASTVRQNTVAGNSAGFGGGISAGSATIVSGNVVTGNRASSGGGGIDGGGVITGNVISGNSGDWGGGIKCYGSTRVENNLIINNSARLGGGLWNNSWRGSQAQIAGNFIAGNIASDGAGIYLDRYSGDNTPSIMDNAVVGNSTRGSGRGGGIFLCPSCRPDIVDNDIFANTANVGADLYCGVPSYSEHVRAQFNYWGTVDPYVIEQHIWHSLDDPSLTLVDYVPFRSKAVRLTEQLYLPAILRRR